MLSNVLVPNVAIGELLWDLLPAGARLGGTTANYAILSSRLGAKSALVSCVGQDDLGREALERLRGVSRELAAANIASSGGQFDASAIQVSEQLPTGTVSVTLDAAGRPHYEINQPVAWDGIQARPELLELAANAGVVCFGTLAQRLATSRTAIRAFVEATPAQCVRVCDLNLRKPFCTEEVVRWCLQHATLIKVSDEELPEVGRLLAVKTIGRGFPHEGKDDDDLTSAAVTSAEALLAMAPGCELVAVTLGPHGSLIASRHDGWDRHRGFRVEVVDTIGAGDAFTAGLVHAYTRGASVAQMNVVSNLCGSYVASQSGATPELSNELLASIRETLLKQ
jgi:fructokinase